MKPNKIFILSGPSAVGKDAVIRCLMKMDLPITRVLNTTTRPKRAKEIAGRHYNFITRKEFEALIAKGEMVEWNEYNDELYGTQASEFAKAYERGHYPLWEIDPTAAVRAMEVMSNVVSILLMPSSWSILRSRLERRDMSEEDIRARLRIGHRELKLAPKFNYRVINYDGKLKNVATEIADIIRSEIELGHK